MAQAIKLSEATQNRLRDLIQQRQVAQAMIDAIVQTARDELRVPDGYVLRDMARGFEPGDKDDLDE